MEGCLGCVIGGIIDAHIRRIVLRLVAYVGLPLGILYFALVPSIVDTLLGFILREGLIPFCYSYSLVYYSALLWSALGRDEVKLAGCWNVLGYTLLVPVFVVSGSLLLAPAIFLEHGGSIVAVYSVAVLLLVALDPLWLLIEFWFEMQN